MVSGNIGYFTSFAGEIVKLVAKRNPPGPTAEQGMITIVKQRLSHDYPANASNQPTNAASHQKSAAGNPPIPTNKIEKGRQSIEALPNTEAPFNPDQADG